MGPVCVLSFFYASILEYVLPLYFSAMGEAAASAGRTETARAWDEVWSTLVVYKVAPWIVGPMLAGLLSRRYGERFVWSGALLGKVLVPISLALGPPLGAIPVLALWQGFTGALMWIAGVSLVQMVPARRKGLSNGLMLVSLGIGSVTGPVVGRAIIYQAELSELAVQGQWSALSSRLLAIQPATHNAEVVDFGPIFWMLTGTTILSGVGIGLWGQRPGKFDRAGSQNWDQTIRDLRRLTGSPRFWALVLSVCLLGGPMLQASNQYLPYRAADLGLKSGSQDLGWIWLSLLKTVMWIPGGAAVGLVAGRQASGRAAVLILAGFALAAFAIGTSWSSWQLFACVALFEIGRQFMRWSQGGYLAEHLPSELRATAIGAAVTAAGIGSTIYGFSCKAAWNAGTQSGQPFIAASVLGIAGSIGLLIFHHYRPIRGSLFEEDGDAGIPIRRRH